MSFFDDASLAFLPRGAAGKDGKAYSIKPTDGTGDFTFSRGSNLAATRVGADGLIEKGRENLLLQSNQFDTTWLGNVSHTSGQSGYDGSNDAWLLQNLGNDNYIYQGISPSGVNTFSIYMKAGNVSWGRIGIVGGTTFSVWFNLSSGAIGTQSNNIDAKIESVGNGWYRCSLSFLANSNTLALVYPAESDNNNAPLGSNIYIQDAQLEVGLAATDYIESGATTGKAGLLEDEPRFDYSGGATCPSLLLEPSRTNLIQYSEYFDNAAWSKINGAITSSNIISPDGNTSAYEFVENGTASSAFRVFQNVSITNGNTYAAGYFFRYTNSPFVYLQFNSDFNSGGTGAAESQYFNIQNGTKGLKIGSRATWDIIDYGNGWYFCYGVLESLNNSSSARLIAYTSDGDGGVVHSGNSTRSFAIWGAQLEQGSYSTSYIPNHSGGSVTRGADDCSVTGASSLIGQTEGTIYLNVQRLINESGVIASVTDGTQNNRLRILSLTTDNFRILFQLNGNVVQYDQNVAVGSVNDFIKIAIAYKSGDIAVYVNGTLANSSSNALTISSTLIDYTLGGLVATNTKEALLFPTRLPNADLATLTTL